MSDLRSIYPCGRIARRRFFFQTAGGFLGTALGSLWAEDGKMAAARPARDAEGEVGHLICSCAAA